MRILRGTFPLPCFLKCKNIHLLLEAVELASGYIEELTLRSKQCKVAGPPSAILFSHAADPYQFQRNLLVRMVGDTEGILEVCSPVAADPFLGAPDPGRTKLPLLRQLMSGLPSDELRCHQRPSGERRL